MNENHLFNDASHEIFECFNNISRLCSDLMKSVRDESLPDESIHEKAEGLSAECDRGRVWATILVTNGGFNMDLPPIDISFHKSFMRLRGIHQNQCREKNVVWTIPSENIPSCAVNPIFLSIPSIFSDNAVKYAAKDSEIVIEFQITDRYHEFSLSNQCIFVSDEELEEILKLGGRGSNVEGVRGSGRGLKLAKRLCDLAGLELNISCRKLGGTNYGEFSVNCRVPISNYHASPVK